MCRKNFAVGHDIHVVFPQLEGRANVSCYGDVLPHSRFPNKWQCRLCGLINLKPLRMFFGVDLNTKYKANYPEWRHYNS
jgi:hypothetical protein